jgi:hypothetical protein
VDPVERFQEARRLLELRQPRPALHLLEPAVADDPDSDSLRVLLAWA